ncbi:hydrogenase expression/formation protein [Neotabrizicola sp. sgz301269]|uniref:hydrogenase expression/formation protein n=1 Tax=Neotabrizicola sp. sgz301269 TaxID=3276282 RepID=UPI00376F4B00
MVSPFTLPPTGFGPGSQPDPEGELQYMSMPSGMRTYSAHVPEVTDPAVAAPVLALLEDMARACARTKTGTVAEFDLSGLSPAQRALMADTLGTGEVAMKIRGIPALSVQESVFAGVWSVAGMGHDRVEVGPVPQAALSRAHIPHRPALLIAAPKPGALANGPAILTELLDRSARWQPGDEAHVINLSLLPHTEADLAWLAEALGEGATTILSRGYGNVRVTATALARVWRVQFFNSMDTQILDTFEVTDMPMVAAAAAEDFDDSEARILDVLKVIA